MYTCLKYIYIYIDVYLPAIPPTSDSQICEYRYTDM